MTVFKTGSQGQVFLEKKYKYLANYGMCIEVANYHRSDLDVIYISVKKYVSFILSYNDIILYYWINKMLCTDFSILQYWFYEINIKILALNLKKGGEGLLIRCTKFYCLFCKTNTVQYFLIYFVKFFWLTH